MREFSALSALVCLLACAPAAPPDSPAPVGSASSPELPPTFSYFLDYEPFSLVLRRNGQPFQGVARLAGPQITDALTFDGGRAVFPPGLLGRVEPAATLYLDVEGQSIPLLPSGARRTFRCALEIEALQSIDPCATALPSVEVLPEDCEPRGQQIWLSSRTKSEERQQACYSTISPETIARLQTAPSLVPPVCSRWIASLGDAPPEAAALALWPICRSYFPSPLLVKTERTYLLKDFPNARVRAETSPSSELEQLYHAYLGSLPKEAEELRQIAIRRFAPPRATEAGWKALRARLEGPGSAERRVELCGAEGSQVFLRVLRRGAPGVYDPMFFGLLAKPRPKPVSFVPVIPSASEQAHLRGVVTAHVGQREVRFLSNCAGGRLWYFHI